MKIREIPAPELNKTLRENQRDSCPELNKTLRENQRDSFPPNTHNAVYPVMCVCGGGQLFLRMKRLAAVNFTKLLTLRHRLSEPR